MTEAIALHGQALQAAEQRHATATNRAKGVRTQIASLGTEKNKLLKDVQRDLQGQSIADAHRHASSEVQRLTPTLSEPEIDEAVMRGLLPEQDAKAARAIIRRSNGFRARDFREQPLER